jgi:hypothetical protein
MQWPVLAAVFTDVIFIGVLRVLAQRLGALLVREVVT